MYERMWRGNVYLSCRVDVNIRFLGLSMEVWVKGSGGGKGGESDSLLWSDKVFVAGTVVGGRGEVP